VDASEDDIIRIWRTVVSDCGGREDMITSFDWNAFFKKSCSLSSRKQSDKVLKTTSSWDEDSDETLATVYDSNGHRSSRRKRNTIDGAKGETGTRHSFLSSGLLQLGDIATGNKRPRYKAYVLITRFKRLMIL
jgi:hypothetical protein